MTARRRRSLTAHGRVGTSRRTGAHVALRALVVLATLAGVLVPAWANPSRTILVPTTLARTLTGDAGAARLVFSATHVAFSWTGSERARVEYRLPGVGGWAQWRRAPQAHDLEDGTRHHSAVIALPRPNTIGWRAIRGARDVTVDYLNTVDGPAREVTIPAVAEAAAETPSIITRAEWGADESVKRTSGSCARQFYNVQQLFVHHTAGTNFDSNPRATMRAIYWYHTVRRGWCDIGYNFVIGADGSIFEGRWARAYAPWETHSSEDRSGRAVAGAHVSGYNSGSVGISMMGNFSQVEVPPAARRSLARLLAWEVDRHDLQAIGKHTYRNPETGVTRELPFIAGHRDAGYTECPGNLLYARLGAVRKDVVAVMGEGKASSTITMQADTNDIAYGSTVAFTGNLVDTQGAPLAGRAVTIYRKDGSAPWAVGAEVTTGLDGSFSWTVTPERTLRAIAFFGGDSAIWGASSTLHKVKVRAAVTLLPEGGTPDPASGTHYPSGTEKVYLSGTVGPRRPGATVDLSVFEIGSDGSRTLRLQRALTVTETSAFRTGFRIPGARQGQRFDAVARLRPDAENAAGEAIATFYID